jgi:hypothetical protein
MIFHRAVEERPCSRLVTFKSGKQDLRPLVFAKY